MQKLTWDVLSNLILQLGLPLALKIASKWGSKDIVTPEEIEELRAMGAQTPRSQMLDAMKRAGLDVTDPKAVALLALIGG
jgi:hypothetical protein